jgi:hypothetical protein
MMVRYWLTRLRRNHALEHATINHLSETYGDARIVGWSGPFGFRLYTTLTGAEVIPAVRRALAVLKAGNTEVAYHANCGTNLVVTALLTTFASLVGLRPTLSAGLYGARRRRYRARDFVQRLPQTVLLNAFVLMFAAPVSQWVQTNLTTDAYVEDLEIGSILTDYQGGMCRVRVYTRAGSGS